MTVAHKFPARTKYKCDICGTEDFWNDSWSRYSSMAHDEACPDDVPTVCSDKCINELNVRIKDGRIRLPRVKATPGYFEVTKERRGY